MNGYITKLLMHHTMHKYDILCVNSIEYIPTYKFEGSFCNWFGIYSTAGHEVGDWEGMNFYTVTKQAVTALTEGLRQELRGIKSNIKITVRTS